MNADNFFKKAYLLIAIQNAILFVLAWIIVNIFPPDNIEFPLRGISIIIVIVIGATLTAYILSGMFQPPKTVKLIQKVATA